MLADIECVLAKEQAYVGKNTRKRAKKSFLCMCYYLTEAESDREKHSVFLAHHRPGARLSGLPLTTTRVLFTGHRQLGRWSGLGLGRTAGGGACKLKLKL